ncbi:uncharacterized protein F5891DRAFT_1198892 [Suillus fuscotomentosus]|uniref:Uncharacterized protein n=1 Tax=Suillus fuscotomentosus TaxID=1912939 RepID=A0AAD4DRG4_9AGAM|nr:uncharacterized protein F5891DRAFT_1198892 [Suillus fuscotomentosus]KAG1889011.1 hypothetical protein F5891DRAFT_1198892 [Suillus fuscotomentosus]
MAPRRTRAKNATTHLAEKQADDDHLAAARAEKEADALAGLTRLAEMQVQIEATQAQAADKPKAVRPRPVPKGRQPHASQSEEPFSKAGRQYANNMDGPGETSNVKDQIFDEDESLGGSNIEIPGGTKQKSKKQTLKAAISGVRFQIDADVNDARANNEKGNSETKSALGGHIQNWRTRVPLKSNSEQELLTTATQPLPSNFSNASKRTSVSSYAPPPPSSKEDNIEDLVGAFGDEDLDETLEREAVAVMTKSQGKQPAMSTISIVSTSTDHDLEPPSSTQPCLKKRTLMPLPSTQPRAVHDLKPPSSTQPCLKNRALMPPPSTQPRAVSSTKRKKLAEVIEFSESEISEFLDTDDDLMEVDGPSDELDADIKPKPVVQNSAKAIRTTTSTSVTTTTRKAPAPPSKKVKLEKNTKQGNIKSEGTSTVLPGTWVEPVSKARSSYLNTDLPSGCHEDGKWVRVFLPTVFLWLSAQEELWVIADAKLLMACKEIFKVVYPDIRYNVTTSGSVFGVVTQRVGEWRSNFGSTALAIAIDFCASNQDSAPAELSELLLVNYGFLYPNPDNIDKTETFRSAFVQELLSTAHLSRILGHADVPVLNTRNLIRHGFFGALGLCAVSLERAFSLLADNTVTIDHEDHLGLPITARRARLKTPKTLNKATGKETVSEHAFSIAKWKSKTDAFIRAAAKKGEAATELTVSMAWKLLKKPSFDKYTSNDSFKDEDDRADVW